MNQAMGLLGRKLGMTQLFAPDGDVIPVTVIQAGPCTVVRVKRSEGHDGYDALQLGFETRPARKVNRAMAGVLKSVGLETAPRVVREVRVSGAEAAKHDAGAVLGASLFTEGQRVDVIGTSKGRGFQGVMRRHNFRGFIRTHGSHEYFRHGGSIGTRLTPGHVLKGKRMPGHMGAEQVTVQNLVVAKVDPERNLVFVRGGVPGPNGGLVTVRHAAKG